MIRSIDLLVFVFVSTKLGDCDDCDNQRLVPLQISAFFEICKVEYSRRYSRHLRRGETSCRRRKDVR